MDSPEQVLGALPALEDDAQGASRETYASLEDGAPSRELPLEDEVANEALPTEEASGSLPRAK